MLNNAVTVLAVSTYANAYPAGDHIIGSRGVARQRPEKTGAPDAVYVTPEMEDKLGVVSGTERRDGLFNDYAQCEESCANTAQIRLRRTIKRRSSRAAS